MVETRPCYLLYLMIGEAKKNKSGTAIPCQKTTDLSNEHTYHQVHVYVQQFNVTDNIISF